MSEPRIPDPTLDALEPDAPIGLDYSEGEPLIGHLVRWVNREHVPECADPKYGGVEVIGARHAAYIAVPCRECFPKAPPPGWRHSADAPEGADGLSVAADPHLAWQVPS